MEKVRVGKAMLMLWILLSLLCSCTSREQIGSFAPAPSPTQRIEEKDNAQWCDQAANALYGRRLCLRNNNLLWGGNVVTEGETLFYSPNEAVYSYCSNTFACISLEEELSLWSLEENAFFIQYDDEWVYYIGKGCASSEEEEYPLYGKFEANGIFRVKKDGRDRQCVVETDSAESMLLFDDILYVLEEPERIRLYTKEGEFLREYPVPEGSWYFRVLQYFDEAVYYLGIRETISQEMELYLWSLTDDSEKAFICSASAPQRELLESSALLFDDRIYVNDGGGLKTVSAATGDVQIICGEKVLSFVVGEEYTYVTLWEDICKDNARILAFPHDGEGWEELPLDLPPLTTYMVVAADDKRIYYVENEGGGDTFDLHWMAIGMEQAERGVYEDDLK